MPNRRTRNGSQPRNKSEGPTASAIWKGAISFSLVNIPVNLHTAAHANELDLDMLDRHDFSPVGYQRVNKVTGKTVAWRDIVKGYKRKKGQYVVLTDEDFRRANVEATRTIDIQAFVARNAIPPYFFETPYYLTPEKHGERVYALLRDALAQADKLAVATIVIRTRQHMAVLLPVDGIIVLNTLRYAQEVRPPPAVKTAANRAKRSQGNGKEVQMALKLIEDMSEPWRPDQYHDSYRQDLLKRIAQKVKSGQTKTLTEPERAAEREPASGKVVDLEALLRRSLDERQGGGSLSARSHRRSTRRRTSRTRLERRA